MPVLRHARVARNTCARPLSAARLHVLCDQHLAVILAGSLHRIDFKGAQGGIEIPRQVVPNRALTFIHARAN